MYTAEPKAARQAADRMPERQHGPPERAVELPAIGNQAAQEMVRRAGALPVSKPSHASEQEAARIADQVVDAGGLEHAAPHSVDGPLPEVVRAELQARLGHDLGEVRVHTGADAAETADVLHARAVTIGHDIYFGAGNYAPETYVGGRLLAHELAHVVQQDGTAAGGSGLAVSRATGVAVHRDAIDDAQKLSELPSRLADNLATFNAIGVSEDLSQLSALTQSVASAAGGGPFPLADPSGAPSSVTAQFFPGRTSRKALIVGGVHNRTEPQGSVVVGKLAAMLTSRIAAGRPPFFSVYLVQNLFDPSRYDPASPRSVRGGMGRDVRGRLERSRSVEPNRNFPLPGEGLADAQRRGAARATAPELVFRDPTSPGSAPRAAHDTPGPGHGGTSTRLLPENRTLIHLIERIQPERIASVHAHSLRNVQGDAPGIFVDPRGVDPTSGNVINQSQVDEDDRLAAAMVRMGRTRAGAMTGNRTDPFAGNIARGSSPASVRYARSATHTEGNSLGQWAPTPVASGPGARAGITTVTVEVPQWNAPGDASALDRVEDLDAQLLAEIFLEDPAVVATGPTTP